MPDCATNPNDPVCQEFYGAANNNNPTTWTYDPAVLRHFSAGGSLPQFHATGSPAAGSTTPGSTPGQIVTISDPTSIWNAIPTWAKVAGAGVIAFIGYRALTKPKAAALSGWRARRRRR